MKIISALSAGCYGWDCTANHFLERKLNEINILSRRFWLNFIISFQLNSLMTTRKRLTSIFGREEFYLQNFILEDIPPSQTDRMFVEMSLNLLLRRLDQTSGINKYWKVGKRKLPSLFLDIHSKLSIQVLQKFCLRREWRLKLKKFESRYFSKNSIGLACFLFPFSLSWTNNVYTFKSEGLGSSYSKPISDQSLYLDLLKTDIFYLPVWTRDWAKPGPTIGLQLYFTQEDFVQDDTR